MPAVYPFRAVQYKQGKGDVSTEIAPPYDVLDAKQKAALLEQNPANVVGFDLPHVPAKELGPPEAYSRAADAYRKYLADGVLAQRERPAMFAYRQTFEYLGKTYQRSGMAVTVDTRPLGPSTDGKGGILPHEQTFSGPKEDRMALMKASRTQFSPVFGLHPDEDGAATAILHEVMASREPDLTGRLADGVLHEVWTVEDEATIRRYQQALDGEDVFIADGHHRYNTAVNYLAHLQEQGDLPPDHPARRTMIVLVGMSDPGLVIGPTHRVLGGMQDYSIEAFQKAAQGILEIEAIENDPKLIERSMESALARGHHNVFGLLDYATGLCFTAWPAVDDPLEDKFPKKPEAWRRLDVALIQHLIVEDICVPALNRGEEIKWAFPHSIDEVIAIGRGEETGSAIKGGGRPQLAIIVRPTPLDAVRDVSKANELMPQKSTFFYPKLATGLFIKSLEPQPAAVTA